VSSHKELSTFRKIVVPPSSGVKQLLDTEGTDLWHSRLVADLYPRRPRLGPRHCGICGNHCGTATG